MGIPKALSSCDRQYCYQTFLSNENLHSALFNSNSVMTILRTIFGGGGRQKSYRTDRVLIRTNKHKFDSRMEIVQSLLEKVGIFANRKFKD